MIKFYLSWITTPPHFSTPSNTEEWLSNLLQTKFITITNLVLPSMDIFVWLLPRPLLLHCWSWTEKIQQKIMKILKHLPKPPAYNLHFHSRLSPLRCLDPPHRSGSPAWRKSFGVPQTGQEENLTDWYWMIIVEKLYISPDLEPGCRWGTAGRRRPGYTPLKNGNVRFSLHMSEFSYSHLQRNIPS